MKAEQTTAAALAAIEAREGVVLRNLVAKTILEIAESLEFWLAYGHRCVTWSVSDRYLKEVTEILESSGLSVMHGSREENGFVAININLY